MKKRIFVGVRPGENIVKRIELFQRKFVDKKSWRLISAGNLHLTLVPPWYVTDTEAVLSKLEKFDKQIFEPITIQYNKMETGPGNKKRLVWLSAPENNNLQLLRSSVHEILKQQEDKRKLIPHITVARRNKGKRPKNLSKTISLTQIVDNITIFESKLSPEGAEYKVIEGFKLI